MRCLADIPSDILMVACAGCRRRGVYRLDGLIAEHGATCDLKSFLETMRRRCTLSPCTADLVVPLRLDLDRTAFPGNTFTVETWTGENSREMHIGAIQNFDIAAAAFDKAVALWPHSTITVRLKSQVMKAHRPDEERARAMEERIFRNLGLR